MVTIQYITLGAVALCIAIFFVKFLQLVRLGKPKEFSQKSGSPAKGIAYANTTAMMPQNKESAFLHLPDYALGIIFHLGTFLTFLIFIFTFCPCLMQLIDNQIVKLIISLLLAVPTVCGIVLIVKRFTNPHLRELSNPDDHISNILSTGMQAITILYLWLSSSCGVFYSFYIWFIILFLYMPHSKLRHIVYYFAARYHIGFFYGWRNVWPPKKEKKK